MLRVLVRLSLNLHLYSGALFSLPLLLHLFIWHATKTLYMCSAPAPARCGISCCPKPLVATLFVSLPFRAVNEMKPSRHSVTGFPGLRLGAVFKILLPSSSSWTQSNTLPRTQRCTNCWGCHDDEWCLSEQGSLILLCHQSNLREPCSSYRVELVFTGYRVAFHRDFLRYTWANICLQHIVFCKKLCKIFQTWIIQKGLLLMSLARDLKSSSNHLI